MGRKGAAGDAAATYTILTVGDGLVSQIPALVISTAAGIIVSRAAGSSALGSQLLSQLFSARRVLNIVAAILVGFGLLPGMPFLVFFGLAAIMFLAGRQSAKAAAADAAPGTSSERRSDSNVHLSGDDADQGEEGAKEDEKIENLLPLDL